MCCRLLCLMAVLFLAPTAKAAESSVSVTLTPPRAAAAHEAIWLKVTVGPLPRGALLLVTGEDGTLAGTISPFGTGPGQTPHDYTLPLPRGAVGEAIRLRLQIREPNGLTRAPNANEVLGESLVYVPTSN